MTTIIPLYDEIGNVRSITLDDGAEPIVLTPGELSALRFAQVEADALREERAELLWKIRKLEAGAADDMARIRELGALATSARHAHSHIGQRLSDLHDRHDRLLAAARNFRSAVLAVNGIADAETALLDVLAALDEKEQKG